MQPHVMGLIALTAAAGAGSAQAVDDRGRPVWTAVYLISHRDLEAETMFTVLSSSNGTTLTLTGSHIVYVSDAMGSGLTPVAARDAQVWRCLRCGFSLFAICFRRQYT